MFVFLKRVNVLHLMQKSHSTSNTFHFPLQDRDHFSGNYAIPTHRSIEGRLLAAETLVSTLDAMAAERDFRRLRQVPILVDSMTDAASKEFAALPERLYIIGEDGRIAYEGAPGPFGYKIDHLETWLKAWSSRKKTE